VIAQLVLWHLGALHPFEKGLTLGLAFGPFLILFVVIAVRRRQDQAAESAAERATGEQADAAEVSGSGATPDQPGTPSPRP
jgi:hypothetical protein